ncbi:MAG: hypothetical protein HWN66_08305 [Candidatus Helarchaeota archaeon]|nr:hypothetical protein [Candidatus Helarchaeota archaeon]
MIKGTATKKEGGAKGMAVAGLVVSSVSAFIAMIILIIRVNNLRRGVVSYGWFPPTFGPGVGMLICIGVTGVGVGLILGGGFKFGAILPVSAIFVAVVGFIFTYYATPTPTTTPGLVLALSFALGVGVEAVAVLTLLRYSRWEGLTPQLRMESARKALAKGRHRKAGWHFRKAAQLYEGLGELEAAETTYRKAAESYHASENYVAICYFLKTIVTRAKIDPRTKIELLKESENQLLQAGKRKKAADLVRKLRSILEKEPLQDVENDELRRMLTKLFIKFSISRISEKVLIAALIGDASFRAAFLRDFGGDAVPTRAAAKQAIERAKELAFADADLPTQGRSELRRVFMKLWLKFSISRTSEEVLTAALIGDAAFRAAFLRDFGGDAVPARAAVKQAIERAKELAKKKLVKIKHHKELSDG